MTEGGDAAATNTFEMRPLHILYFVAAPSHGASLPLPTREEGWGEGGMCEKAFGMPPLQTFQVPPHL